MESHEVQMEKGLQRPGTTRITLTWRWSHSKSLTVSNRYSIGMTRKRLRGLCSFKSRNMNLTSKFKRNVSTMNTTYLVTIYASWRIDGRPMKTIQSTELTTCATNYLNKTDGVLSKTFRLIQSMHLNAALADP